MWSTVCELISLRAKNPSEEGERTMTGIHDDLFKWLKAEQDAIEKNEHDFTCPICGSLARWERSEYNGHVHSWCTGCGMRVME